MQPDHRGPFEAVDKEGGVHPILWASVSRAPEAHAARPQGGPGLRSRSTPRARGRERDWEVLSRISRAGVECSPNFEPLVGLG